MTKIVLQSFKYSSLLTVSSARQRIEAWRQFARQIDHYLYPKSNAGIRSTKRLLLFQHLNNVTAMAVMLLFLFIQFIFFTNFVRFILSNTSNVDLTFQSSFVFVGCETRVLNVLVDIPTYAKGI